VSYWIVSRGTRVLYQYDVCAALACDFLTLKTYIVSVDMVTVQLGHHLFQRPRRLARPRTPPSHGDNKSSNLFGDTNHP
jgi:hypothetical protein